MDRETIIRILQEYNELNDWAMEVADKVKDIRGISTRFLTQLPVEFYPYADTPYIEAGWEDTYGNNNPQYIRFPMKYLYTDFIKLEFEAKRLADEEKERKAKEQKKQSEIDNREKRRKLFEKLKAEFDVENINGW